LPKKIQFQLLLADLALQRYYSLACGRKIRHPLRPHHRINFNRPRHLVRPVRRP
jgi:hypothetical protein